MKTSKYFRHFNDNYDYAVLRNARDAIFCNSIKDDIDLLFDLKDIASVTNYLKNNGFKRKQDSLLVYTYLYNARPHIHFYNDKIHFDIVTKLTVRSPLNQEFMSLHQDIQNSLLQNRIFCSEKMLWTISHDDEFVTLVSHCIFDKFDFSLRYQKRIFELLNVINIDSVETKLQKIFYKSTAKIMSCIKQNQMDRLMKLYLENIKY